MHTGVDGPSHTLRDSDGNVVKVVERQRPKTGTVVFDGERVKRGQAKIKGLLTGFPERIASNQLA